MRRRPSPVRVRKLLCSLWLAAVPATALAQSDHDAFVLAGQSNVVGASTQNEELLAGRVTSPSPAGVVSWTFRQSDHRWTMANEFPCASAQCTGTNCAYPGPNRTAAAHPRWTDHGAGTCVCTCGVHINASNQDADAGRGSAWPTFAQHWMEQRGRPVHFIATAIGNQCLVGAPNPTQPAWDPDAMDCSALPPVSLGVGIPSISAPGELYCRMLETVALARDPELRAVLWLQGECDASVAVPADVYAAALEHFADAIWRDLHVPLIVAPISLRTHATDTCVADARIAAIHAATIDAAAAHPRILLGPSSDGLALEPDCTHVHDVVTLGTRWYGAVSQRLPACNDGLDNDGEGATDVRDDVGCTDPMSGSEDPACQNGVDDDGDGAIDFDGGAAALGGTAVAPIDRECAGPASEEVPAACGAGAELIVVLGAIGYRRRRHALV